MASPHSPAEDLGERYAAVLFDIDGTLIDSNDEHARAWQMAMAEYGHRLDIVPIRSRIGTGSDKLLPSLTGVSADSEEGQAMIARKGAIFRKSIPFLRPTRGARHLLAHLHAKRLTLVAATSAHRDEVDLLLDVAGVADFIRAASTSDSAESSKPDPDVIQAALTLAGVSARQALMIGDTPYDVEAARRAGVSVVALRCGGWWSDGDLSGAIEIHDDPEAVVVAWALHSSVRS